MRRSDNLRRLGRESFDLLVVGGGMTGAGVAWDAALRGLSVALVEKDDFGSGTSSRSSKLLHGGLRYLRRAHLAIVREGLRERRENERMAPHLVRKTRFVVPRYGSWRLGVRAGLTIYDLLGLGSGYPRHGNLPAGSVLEMAPALRDDVDGGIEYWDASADDARLVWTVVRSAAERGAAVANHARVVSLLSDAGRVVGASVHDDVAGRTIGVRARVVVNATGVWADEIRHLESPDAPIGIRPSRGVHLVLSARRVPLDAALLLPARDGRFVFVVPWVDGSILVGTTDVDHRGPLDDPEPSGEEVGYLLDTLNEVLASPIDASDIVSTFAGLRPLVSRGGRTKDISRRHLVDVGPKGMVTITGGKLTAWRPMARDAVDVALRAGAFEERPPSRTKKERLSGAAFRDGVVPALEAVCDEVGLDAGHATRLYERYGAHAARVVRMAGDDAELAERLHPELPYLRAEAAYAISSELAVDADDVLARRLRVTLTSSDRGAAALGWTNARLR